MRSANRMQQLLGSTLLAVALAPSLALADGRLDGWNPWFELNGGADSDQGIFGGGRAFVPFWQDSNSLGFFDLQASSVALTNIT